MRVPIPVVIALVFCLTGGVWWANTRHMDFLTPPSVSQLEKIRHDTAATLPVEISSPPPAPEPVLVKAPEPPPEPPKPSIDLGDLTAPPTLQHYAELSPRGPAHLILLATALEENSQPQRALLAWERVLDFTKPTTAETATALAAIQRLRPSQPSWNTKPEGFLQLTLHASTSKKRTKILTLILETLARELEATSGGIVKIKSAITSGKSSKSSTSPIAIRLAGPSAKSATTEVISFTADSPDAIRLAIFSGVYQLIRSHLARSTAYTPPPEIPASEAPLAALASRVTRLSWYEFAAALNAPAKKSQ